MSRAATGRSIGIASPLIFFEKHSTDADAHKHARTLIPMNTRTQPYSYEHLRETEPANSRD